MSERCSGLSCCMFHTYSAEPGGCIVLEELIEYLFKFCSVGEFCSTGLNDMMYNFRAQVYSVPTIASKSATASIARMSPTNKSFPRSLVEGVDEVVP